VLFWGLGIVYGLLGTGIPPGCGSQFVATFHPKCDSSGCISVKIIGAGRWPIADGSARFLLGAFDNQFRVGLAALI